MMAKKLAVPFKGIWIEQGRWRWGMTQFCSMAQTLKKHKNSQDSFAISHTDLENSADFVHVIFFFLMVFDLKKNDVWLSSTVLVG